MKRFGLCALVCLAVLAFCVRPFPVFAQSGNSTCTVTADAREPESTQEPGAEERPEPGEPDDGPGDEAAPGTTEAPGEGEPDAGKDTGTTKDPGEGEGTPESGKKPVPTKRPAESNPAKEPGKGEAEKETGNSDAVPEAEETPTATPEPGAENGETPEPEKDSREDGNRNHPDLLSFIIAVLLGIVVLLIGAMAVGALFPYLWMFLLFYFCRRSRKRFHGILTDEDNRFIRLENVTAGARAVQDIIDETGSLRECVAEILKEETITCIPKQSRMVFVYSDRQGGTVSREEAADEAEMFRILEELEGTGQVKVWIRCRRAGIDIPLEFWV